LNELYKYYFNICNNNIYLDSPPVNGNSTRKNATSGSNRSRVNLSYEKPLLRSSSSSSTSPSPKTNRRIKGKNS
jgi:activator of HSP90 ATPase